jgi:hypothetical protein
MKYLYFIALLFLSVSASAQNGTASPYSFIGLGDVVRSKTVEEVSMGGIGVAYSDGVQVGFTNPAALSSMRFTSFGVGAVHNTLNIIQGEEKDKATVASVSYLSLGFPLGNNAGMLLGLMPASNVGYSLVSVDTDEFGNAIESNQYRGTGATNRVFMGIGFKVMKNLSLGVEGEYLFGNIEHNILNQRRDVQYGTRYFTDANVNGFRGKLGFLYQNIFKDNIVNIGGKFNLQADARFTGNQFFFPVNLQLGEDIPRGDDTPVSVSGDITYPLGSSLGFGYGKINKWFAEIDYNFSAPIRQSGDAFESGDKFRYANYSKIAFGGNYTPNYNSISSYWARATYRMGFQFENTGLLIDGNNNGSFESVKDYGMAFGIGLPMKRSGSKLNIGVDFGRKGMNGNGLVQENYVNIRLGVALLDRWFVKRQIN